MLGALLQGVLVESFGGAHDPVLQDQLLYGAEGECSQCSDYDECAERTCTWEGECAQDAYDTIRQYT